ncbi:MAG: hypothetical protein V8Q42_10895 [Anaerovoracaceae bacterium]
MKSNRGSGLASAEWARIYEETNSMFPELNSHHLTEVIRNLGYNAANHLRRQPSTVTRFISHWSSRHFAYAAGLWEPSGSTTCS